MTDMMEQKLQIHYHKIIYDYASEGKTIQGWVFLGFPTGWSENVLGAKCKSI